MYNFKDYKLNFKICFNESEILKFSNPYTNNSFKYFFLSLKICLKKIWLRANVKLKHFPPKERKRTYKLRGYYVFRKQIEGENINKQITSDRYFFFFPWKSVEAKKSSG